LAITPRLRLLIADDRLRSREGLRALLGTWPAVEVVGEAVDGRDVVQQVAECCPDVVVMDARMPATDGLEATRLIKATWPQVRVVILTMYPSYKDNAIAAGADAFLVKGCPADELMTAIMVQESKGLWIEGTLSTEYVTKDLILPVWQRRGGV
jgi:DNA-binding NarL/FixJ family response regulator